MSLGIDPSIRLYVKQFKGHVYLAIKADKPSPVFNNPTSSSRQHQKGEYGTLVCLAFDQVKELAELRQQIAGKERTPSEQVFKNIQDYKEIPAAGLLRGMEFYTWALGVDCIHCHVVDQWEKDDKPAKRIARDMARMVDTIQESLETINNLKSERPGVSSATCHRGQLKPAISMTPPASK